MLISTNPKPLLLPVSRSEMTSALSTLPYCENSCSRSELLTRYVRFPTYSFLPTINLLKQGTTQDQLSGIERLGPITRPDEWKGGEAGERVRRDPLHALIRFPTELSIEISRLQG